MCPKTALRPRVGNSSSFVLDQADASGDDGEEEKEFDNASQDSRFASDAMIISLMMKKILIWPSRVSIFRT
jgi:hypothetical protein